MSNTTDPWAQAQAIVEHTGAAGVVRWTEDLPYLFQVKGSRGMLVHHGAVVTARGPAAAAAYLRDIGILDGKGPSPRSILTLLFVLHAFPTIAGLPEESAVDMHGPPDLRPRVERAAGHAQVILTYGLPSNNPGPSRGTVPMMRETLDIGPATRPGPASHSIGTYRERIPPCRSPRFVRSCVAAERRFACSSRPA